MHRFRFSAIITILLLHSLTAGAFAQIADGVQEGRLTTQPAADAHVLNEVFGEEFMADNVRSICRKAAGLDPAERFEFLCQWVLPGTQHADFRVEGILTQTDPSPLALELDPAIHRTPRGASIVSPVFDLLDAAAETARLAELRDRISETVVPEDEFQLRARTALRALAHLELRETAPAETALAELHTLASAVQAVSLHDQWPETLVVYRTLRHFPEYRPVGDLLTLLYSQRTLVRPTENIDEWHTQVVSLIGQFQQLGDEVSLGDFVPVVRTRAESRGEGSAHARWERAEDNAVYHVAGHQDEYLFYHAPLRGNFTVECDVGCCGTTHVLAGGRFIGATGAPDLLETGTFRAGAHLEPVAPPLGKMRDWMRYRARFHDGTLTVYLSGRVVQEEQLPEHYDPWIGIRSWWRHGGRFRDFRLAGQPEVPEFVVMSASPALTGWLPYYDDSIGITGADWRWEAGVDGAGRIIGARDERLAGSFRESLLRYHRPIDEIGSVEYEFFYEPGFVEVHPALDRLAFILDPDGVRLHWMTDGRFDRTEVRPDNLVDGRHEDLRRLPLKGGEWNRLELSIHEGVAHVVLNGEPVFDRAIEPANRRTFGLFHYADQTEARVRNVVMRGNWNTPSEGPDELADTRVAELDAGRDRLTSVFTHDFRQGLPAEHFRTGGDIANSLFSTTADGIFAHNSSSGTWSHAALITRFAMLGDFDVEASFDHLDTGADQGESTILLTVTLDGAPARLARAGRTRHAGGEFARGQFFIQYVDGGQSHFDTFLPDESHSGRVRVARRGDTVTMLFAEADSPLFRVVGVEPDVDGPVAIDGIALSVLTNEHAQCGVVWKDLTLRAEQLQYIPEVDETLRLYAMGADGSNLRELLSPPGDFTHLGSPEWSADGRLITLDVSTGTTTTSHIFVVNVDDGKASDLGPGCMPSFSRDGRQIVFSQPGQGIVMMDADGAGRRVIDRSGWGVQFSPDGKYIAYGKSGNVTLRNVASGEQRELLRGPHATRYNYVYWNLGWSHDSRSIAFKARNRQTGEDELAVADVDSPDGFQVLYTTTGSLNVDFTFSPDNEQVLFAMHNPAHQGPQLYLCSRNAPGPPELLPGQPSDLKILDCAWSSDDLITFAGQRIPQPVDWPPAGGSDQRPE